MSFKSWTEKHSGIWQFILFNVLSNISTITRFVLTWAGTAIFVTALGLTSPFSFLIFDYSSADSNGLGGFITYLIAEVLAQVVNYFVQKTWVFKSSTNWKDSAWKYAVLAVVIVVVNLVLPAYVVAFCKGTLGLGDALSSTISSVVNTLLAVVISFPALKFWIMPPDNPNTEAESEAKAE